ncbi:MAG: shikimate dehydrogenase, partial [Pseudomonas sp.]
ATVAGAVNTLYRNTQGRLVGENTDGIGMLRDILQNGGVLRNRRVLVVGAGGAVRGVVPNLLAQQPAELVVVNRTAGKAQALAERFRGLGMVRGGGYDLLADTSFDWVINGSSAGLDGEPPPLPPGVVTKDTWSYDMVYGPGLTAFQQWCLDHGAARALDGLGMLVEQAAEAFYLWRGVRPQTAPVIAALRQELAGYSRPASDSR